MVNSSVVAQPATTSTRAMLLFLIFLILFFALTAQVRSSERVRQALRYDPARLVRTLVLVICALWLLPLFEPNPNLEYGWFGLYFAAAAISVYAFAFGTRIRVPDVVIAIPRSWPIRIVVAVSLPFTAYYLLGGMSADLAALGQFSLSEIRQDHWADFGETKDRLPYLLAFAAFPAAHLWPLRSRRSPIFWYSLLLFAMFALRATAIGSRTSIVFSIAVCYLLLHTRFNLRPWFMIRRRPFAALVLFVSALGAAYLMFFYVLLEREPQLVTAYEFMAAFVVGGRPEEWLVRANEATDGAAGILSISLGYFSSTLTYFNLFASNYEGCRCVPQFGVYNFPAVDSFAGEDWFDIRESISTYWGKLGVAPNPWSSGYRDWLVDFGVFGSLAFNAVFMLLMGILVGGTSRRRDPTAALMAAYATAFALVTPLLSPLLLLDLSMPFFWLIALYVLTKTPSVRRTASYAQLRCSPRWNHSGGRQ